MPFADTHRNAAAYLRPDARWQGWARDGHLPAGERFDDGPTVYRIEKLKEMLARVGLLAPPYPDPDGSGACRVPLCGGSVRRADGRVAIVDADTLALLDGAVLSWESVYRGQSNFVGLCRPEKPTGVARGRRARRGCPLAPSQRSRPCPTRARCAKRA